jgi:hypothetical protein
MYRITRYYQAQSLEPHLAWLQISDLILHSLRLITL